MQDTASTAPALLLIPLTLMAGTRPLQTQPVLLADLLLRWQDYLWALEPHQACCQMPVLQMGAGSGLQMLLEQQPGLHPAQSAVFRQQGTKELNFTASLPCQYNRAACVVRCVELCCRGATVNILRRGRMLDWR